MHKKLKSLLSKNGKVCNFENPTTNDDKLGFFLATILAVYAHNNSWIQKLRKLKSWLGKNGKFET